MRKKQKTRLLVPRALANLNFFSGSYVRGNSLPNFDADFSRKISLKCKYYTFSITTNMWQNLKYLRCIENFRLKLKFKMWYTFANSIPDIRHKIKVSNVRGTKSGVFVLQDILWLNNFWVWQENFLKYPFQ